MKLNAKELRDVDENIYDTYNIGGLFRLADALAIEKIYLCGEMEVPPNSRIKKASIGTYKVVPWEYKKTAGEAIEELRNLPITNNQFPNKSQIPNNKLQVIAVEQHPTSIPYQKADYSLPIALILGNETYGVTEETLKLADSIVEIPMFGVNKSLNVIVSAAIVSYWVVSNQ